ncbi:MAG: AGE family epimerase/isomerase [Myxococcota bacterium]
MATARTVIATRRLLLTLAFSLVACAHESTPRAPIPPPAADSTAPYRGSRKSIDANEARRREAIRQRLEALAHDSIAFWKRHGVDAQRGGFHATLDRTGQPAAPFEKGLIQQARHLWTFSTWYARREPSPEIRAIADAQFRFLTNHFHDARDGEFFFKVSAEGKVVDRKKPLYAQSFAIYALAQYAQVFASDEARNLALTCFRSIDRRAHDPVHQGYDQTEDPFYFTPGTQKQTNTHIHLMEAFTTLYRLTQDPLVRDRLAELAEVTARRIVRPDGYARQEFKRDFTPFGITEVSYGHDIETAWLLFDAFDALGWSEKTELHEIAYRLGRSALASGYDARHGGLFEAGEPSTEPSKLDKVWWIQAETLPGLVRLYAMRPEPSDLTRLEQTLSFIEDHLHDKEYGEWYWSRLADGSASTHPPNKGEEWKASYHSVRGLVFASDWLKALR